MSLRSVWVMAVLGLFASHAGAALAASNGQAGEVASGLIIKLKASADEGKLATAVQAKARFNRLGRMATAAGYTSVMPWRHINGQTMVLATPTPLTPALQQKLTDRLMATGQVEWVVPNVRQLPSALAANEPNDSQYGAQWWLAPQAAGSRGVPGLRTAWDTSTGSNQPAGSRSVVAVLDTGYYFNKGTYHEDLPTLNDRLLPGRDFVSNPAFSGDGDGWDPSAVDPGDGVNTLEASTSVFRQIGCGVDSSSWHGSTVMGILAANSNNGVGVAGVTWGARILPVRVAGKCGAELADIVAGMYWAAGVMPPSTVLAQEDALARNPQNRSQYLYSPPTVFPPLPPANQQARVINLSFGGLGSCDPLYQDAVNALAVKGTVVVAAAGNEHNAVARPANCPGVVAVAGLNRAGLKSTYSNFGPQITVSTVSGDPGPSKDYSDAGAWGKDLSDLGLLSLYPEGPDGSLGNFYASHAGTSFAAPIVSGVISLMLDVNRNLSVAQIIEGLKVSSRPHVLSSLVDQCANSNPGRCVCTTATCGAGILDAPEALRYAANPGNYSRTRNAANLDTGAEAVDRAASIPEAARAASQDRPPNPIDGNILLNSDSGSSTSGGGGGSLAWPDLLMLAALAALIWRLSPRRQ